MIVRSFVLVLALVLTSSLTVLAHSHHKHIRLECNVDKALEKGKYDWVHAYFKEGTPKATCKQREKVNVDIFIFEENTISAETVKERMKEDGCRPATWPELLALGATHVDTTKTHDPHPRAANPIVALGSIWNHESGQKTAPTLVGGREKNKYRRLVHLYPSSGFSNDKYTHWVFAAVCGEKKK